MTSKPDKKLFTPGPLLCSAGIKQAMQRDLGSRDLEFIEAVKFVRSGLLKVAGVTPEEWTVVPMQGSGTFSVEAVFQTAVPKNGKVLIMANGAYGSRMKKICETVGIECDFHLSSEAAPVPLETFEKFLKKKKYDLVATVHCETSSGVMNDVEAMSQTAKSIQPSTRFFVDAMSSFGAVPLSLTNVDYLVSSANKCLEGVPGFGYAICRKSALAECKGNSRSLSLDLFDQHDNLEKSGQFRFTPPTHTILAFKQALEEFWQEGGVAGRASRYQANRAILKAGLTEMGFRQLVPNEHAGYIITTYLCPPHPNFDFKMFYQKLSDKDQVIYPGKVGDSFRIGNIGHLFPKDLEHLMTCIKQVLSDMKVPLPIKY